MLALAVALLLASILKLALSLVRWCCGELIVDLAAWLDVDD